MSETRLAADAPDILFQTGAAAAQSEILLSATLHLMSHYSAQGGGLKLAAIIERHLQALANAQGVAPVVRATCQQLAQQWAQAVPTTLPRAPRRGLFGRLLTPFA